MTNPTLQIVVIILILVPALAIVLWPLFRRGWEREARAGRADDRRLELVEQKTAVYRALKELTFDYEAGHLSEDDYQALRARYETQAAEVLSSLDALGPPEPVTRRANDVARVEPGTARQGWARHPLTLAGGAAGVLLFGIVIGLGVTRFAEPERVAMAPGSIAIPLSPDLAAPSVALSAGAGPEGLAGRPIPPEVLAGMLQAARQSLMENRYPEAIAAYQAVLKRDPRNVDAMTHLALIVAIGGHADQALETFDKALKIDPRYAPAYLYRGQVLYEVKQDYPGAMKAWESFLALVPNGEEHDQVAALVKEARTKQGAR